MNYSVLRSTNATKRITISAVFLVIIGIALGCKKDDNPVVPPPETGVQVLLVVNQGDGSVMEFDANTHERLDSTWSGVNKPHHVEFSRDGEFAYVVNRDAGGKIAKFSLESVTLLAVATGGANVLPTSLAISPDGLTGWTTDFTGSGNGHFQRYNLQTMQFMDSLVPTGRGTHDIKITTDGNTLVAVNYGSDNLTILNVGTGHVDQVNVNDANPFISTIHYGPYGVLIDNADSLVYIACRVSNDVRIMDLKTHAMLDSIAVPPTGASDPAGPCLMHLSPDGTKLYVTTQLDNQLIVISTVTKTILKTITFSATDPFGVFGNDDGSRVYVACVNDLAAQGRIYVIDGTTNAVVDSITAGKNPYMVHFHDHAGHHHGG